MSEDDGVKRKLSLEELMQGISDGTIKQGPIHHPKLPLALLKENQRLWHSVGKAFYGGNGTLEQWEIGFMRDCNPDKETLIWQRIEWATERYMADHPEADLGDTVAGVCLCSLGTQVPEYQKYWEKR